MIGVAGVVFLNDDHAPFLDQLGREVPLHGLLCGGVYKVKSLGKRVQVFHEIAMNAGRAEVRAIPVGDLE